MNLLGVSLGYINKFQNANANKNIKLKNITATRTEKTNNKYNKNVYNMKQDPEILLNKLYAEISCRKAYEACCVRRQKIFFFFFFFFC